MNLKRVFNKTVFYLAGLLFLSLYFNGADATSKVGSGGDIVDRFLEDTKAALRTTTETLLASTETDDLDICDQVLRLDSDQKQFCNAILRDFLGEYRNNFIRKPVNELKLSTEELFVTLPDKTVRQVKALTECGPTGPIILHYKSIERLSPVEMFILLAHEYFHKTKFQNAACLEDSGVMGPFSGMEGGRKLIDAMSEALGIYAISQGIVGEEFGITDYFTCRVDQHNGPIKFSFPVPTQRIFFQNQPDEFRAYSQYLSGTEKFPRDGECSFGLGNGDTEKLNLKLSIVEKDNCDKYGEAVALGSRSLVLQLIKTTKLQDQPEQIEIIDTKRFPGVNPLCEKEKTNLKFSALF